MNTDKTQALEIVTEPDWQEKFSTARQYHSMVGISLAQGAAFMILCGAELHRLKRELGETRGRRGNTANVCSFSQLAQQNTGISERTVFNYLALYQGAKKRLPLLNVQELLNTPIGKLPELKRQQLLEAVKKITDGQTAQQLMWDWGITKTGGTGRQQGCDAGGNSTVSTGDLDLTGFDDFFVDVNQFCWEGDEVMAGTDSPKLFSLVTSLKVLTARLEKILAARKRK
jgi:hypothetical protein